MASAGSSIIDVMSLDIRSNGGGRKADSGELKRSGART
jgi:hypothetical protein